MKRFRALSFLPLAASGLLLSSCSKSPSGGPQVAAPNRLDVTLTTAGNINPNYYYAVAFDDNPNDGQGPEAIDSVTTIPNRIIGGTWRVLVLYHARTFTVYYRSDATNEATEVPIAISPFVTTPTATGNQIHFIFNLDARIDNNTFFFPQRDLNNQLTTQRIDLNFAATNVALVGNENNGIVKPVDAAGPATLASPVFNFQINTTRRTTITDQTGADLDERPDVNPVYTNTSSPQYVDFSTIDVSQLDISIIRSNN